MVSISIIIPVYNSAPFLKECVYSLLQQSFRDFEIWLVDDGSTDGSAEICDDLAVKDTRVHVLHTPNNGAAHARQMGVERAQGKYFFFADSDDRIPSDGLERLYKVAVQYPKSDIVVGFCRHSCRMRSNIWTPRQYRNLLIEGRHNIGTLWGKLFRNTLFQEGMPKLPSHLVMGEDMLINICLAFRTKENIQVVRGRKVYDYIQRDSSISRKFKLTADYEKDFHEERLRMIPASAHVDYLPVMIHRRLRILRRLYRRAHRKKMVEQLQISDFVRQLVDDISLCKYSFWSYPSVSLWIFLRRSKKK